MSREQLLQTAPPQMPPDITKYVLLTVERHIHENVDPKFKLLTEQVMRLRDELRALQRSMVDDFIDSLVKSLTEERVRSALGDTFEQLGVGIARNVEKIVEVIERLYKELNLLSQQLTTLSSRVDSVEKMLTETPPAQKVQIDLTPTETKLQALGRQVDELEKRIGEIAAEVERLERTVRRALEGFATFVEELEREVQEREEEGEET